MNDNELDDMLNRWEAPEAPRTPRRLPRPAHRFGVVPRLFAGAMAAAVALFFVAGRAQPQAGGVPYIVDSALIEYNRGEPVESAHITSFNRNGSEVLVSVFEPDNVFKTVFGQLVRAVHGASPVNLTPEQQAARRLFAVVYTGCQGHGCFMVSSHSFVDSQKLLESRCEAEGKVIGRESVAGYPTVAVQPVMTSRDWRVTIWRAPGLGCFALRVKSEFLPESGRWEPIAMKQAVKVTVNAK